MKHLLLNNKHQLAWTEYGASGGDPIFYFHGIPGSSLEPQSADAVARDLGIHLIAPDRPGYGSSDPQDGFSLLDWPKVISRLANELNLKRFSILAYSGGGAYALACAHEMADRINHISLISSIAPFDTAVTQDHLNADFKPLYELAAADYSAAMQQITQLAHSPEALLNVLLAPLPAADLAVFDQAHIQSQYLKNLRHAIAKSVNGIVSDLCNVASAWQFKLEDIQTPINIWHGRDDNNIGFATAEYLANTLKNSSTQFLDNSGHYYLFTQWREILERTMNYKMGI